MAFKFGKGEGVPGHERRMAALEMAKQREQESTMAGAEAVGLGLSIAGAIAGGIMGGPPGVVAGWQGGQALGGLGKAAVASGQGRSGEASEHLKGAIGSGIAAAPGISDIMEGGEGVDIAPAGSPSLGFEGELELDETLLTDLRAKLAEAKRKR